MPLDVKRLEELESLALEQLDPDSDDYDDMSSQLSEIGSILDNHYRNIPRKVDASGKVTEETSTRRPARVGDGESSYFFEPSVAEVQAYLKRNPTALDRLQSDGLPLRQWAEGEAQPSVRSPAFDPAGGVSGYYVIPGKTHLEMLTPDQPAYGTVADDMWNAAMTEAQKKGTGLKRYRDIKLDENEWKDYVEGGIKKGLERVVAPVAMGAADALSAGQASPLYDAMRDLSEYRQSRMSPAEQQSARDWGYDPNDAESMGTSEDIRNRDPAAYVAGNIAGYASPYAPANIAQNIMTQAAQYGARGIPGRLAISAVAGGVSNAGESVLGDMARYANEGDAIPIGEAAYQMGMNALQSLGIGSVASTGFDALGQGVGALRDLYRDRPLQTFEQAGGEAGVLIPGTHPTKEMADAHRQVEADSLDDTKAPRMPAGEMAEKLAPHLRESVVRRAANEREATAAQMEEYYNHPAYRDMKVSARPAVEGLVDMAQRNFRVRGPVDSSVMPMHPKSLDEIGGILRDYSQLERASVADAPRIAHEKGGSAIDGELANRLYGFKPDDPRALKPGQMAIIRPIELTASDLTILEGRIDHELQFARNQGAKDDPVWNRFNQTVKSMRDDFPAYKDAEGKLVPPPADEVPQAPFEPADDVPRGPTRGQYMAPPTAVGEPSKPPHIDKPGIGPGAPDLPNPFDPLLPTARESINPQPTIDVQGSHTEPGYIGPEAIPGVGPNYQPPNDPRRLGPPVAVQGQFDMGGEYSQPPMVGRPDQQGVGPRFNPRGTMASPVEPQPTQAVQGTYDLPPEVKAEPAPATNRNPYGFAQRGQPEPEVPLPPSERNPFAPSPVAEESLSTLAGNKLAMKASDPAPTSPVAARGEEPLRGEPELTEEVYQREYGPTKPVPDEVEPIRGETLEQYQARGGKTGSALPPEIQAKVDDGTLTSEAQQKTVNEEIRQQTEAPTGKRYAILDQQDGAVREKTFATAAEAKAEAKRLGEKFKSKGRFKVKGVDGPAPAAPDERGGLERMLDERLASPDAPPVPKTEIEEIGAQQTADREQVAENWQKADELFSKNREERAVELEKLRALGEDPRVIDEAIEQVKRIDARLGPISQEQRIDMLLSAIKAKTGKDIKVDDLVRFGLISAGLVQMSEGDDDSSAIGAALFGFGFGKGKKGTPEAPKGPSRPTQPEARLEDGRIVRGFSAMRSQQHTRQEAIEKAMERIGVRGDTTLENRIRTYGQLQDRGPADQALLDEANLIGRGRELRNAAGANAYETVSKRASGKGNQGILNKVLDILGIRAYKAGEYLSGRYTRNVPPGDDGLYRNPYVTSPSTTLGEMQRTLLEDPARRLLDLTRGGPAAREGGEWLYEQLRDKSRFEPDEDQEKKQKEQRP